MYLLHGVGDNFLNTLIFYYLLAIKTIRVQQYFSKIIQLYYYNTCIISDYTYSSGLYPKAASDVHFSHTSPPAVRLCVPL